ncbi:MULTISPECIES: outer membrane protein [Mesorhizobium]|uniref:Porin family protein n=1 Tax=Mesorhizobium denitrificans TaxID=2294114 RepID=A0A371XIN9_9HYPH|nr:MULTISPECIES: outer membrane protein [Mesorhizobium]RFC69083.1 porin family protein [Mesorhizobium denitrificans]
MSANLKFARPLALASVIALLGAAPVFAADAIEQAPEPAVPMEQPPLATWTGPYAGIQLGYGFSGRVKEPGNTVDTDGFVGGAFGGYQAELGNGLVAGVEGDVGYSNIKGDNAGTEAKSGVDGSLRARLGYAVTPDILPYITGGGAAQSLKVTEGGVSDRNTMLGWTAGAGVDVKVTENMFVRGEYRYTDFGNEDFTTGSGTRSVDSKDNRVSLGVGFKF